MSMQTHIDRPAACGRLDRRLGFTLVELLVVIGIIAVLISILLPAINAARAQANTVKCLAAIKQLGMAAQMEFNDRHSLQPVSEIDVMKQLDPSHNKYLWIANPDPAATDKVVPASWISALMPYLMGRDTPELAGNLVTLPILICPSDSWEFFGGGDNATPNGYFGGPNVFYQGQGNLPNQGSKGTDYIPCSYGINLDITCGNVGSPAMSTYIGDTQIAVYHGQTTAAYGDSRQGLSAGGKLTKVQGASDVILFAECGVRPPNAVTYSADRGDSLTFTTNFMVGNNGDPTLFGTLAGIMQTSWLRNRFPIDRHDRHSKVNADGTLDWTGNSGRLNVAFVDGHAETISRQDFTRVRVSPFR